MNIPKGLKYVALLLFVSAAGSSAWASQGYASLKITSGARESAMGESGVAGAISATSIRWNPALLVEGAKLEAAVHYTSWLVGTSQGGLFLKRRLGPAAIGVGLLYFSGGEIELRDSIPSDNPLATYSFSDLSLAFGGAVELVKGTKVGLVARYFSERLWNYSGSNWGLDAGLSFEPLSGLNFGFSIVDLGFDIRLKGQVFKPPMTMRAGGSFTHDWSKNVETALNLDFLYRPYDQEPGVRTGLEVKLFNLLSLRAGVKMLYLEDEKLQILPPTEFLTFGIGVAHKGVSVDYALVPYERMDLGLTHRISLNLAFE